MPLRTGNTFIYYCIKSSLYHFPLLQIKVLNLFHRMPCCLVENVFSLHSYNPPHQHQVVDLHQIPIHFPHHQRNMAVLARHE